MLQITQATLAMYAGVSIKFVIQLEQGKKTLRMDKVLDVLRILGATLEPVRE
jgi:y4mF family transcriptional regulator